MIYVEVIVPLAAPGPYTYLVPDDCPTNPQLGMRVLVPLGPRKIYTGVISSVLTTPPPTLTEAGSPIAYKAISCFLEDFPMVTPAQLRFWQWLSEYYMCTLGEVMKAALPAALKLESETRVRLNPDFVAEGLLPSLQTRLLDILTDGKPHDIDELARLLDIRTALPSINVLMEMGAVYVEERVAIPKRRKKKGDFLVVEEEVGAPHVLNEAQTLALEQIHASFAKHPVTLLHGVTSSGKTEVYITLIQEALDCGQQVLFLVPEIALTTQLTARLRRVFGSRLGVYHSRLNDSERLTLYRDVLLHRGHDVIIGVRSSLFLPFQRLGLLIIDEEHDASYKQQDPAPRYHARSAGIVLASIFGAKTLLGTATPAVETYHNALSGKFGLVTLATRYRGLSLPDIHLIDLQRQYHRKEMYGHFSDPLLIRMKEELQRNKQVILFQNRRGYAGYVECRQCAYVPKCVNCDVSLTEHRFAGLLVCHYCGYSIPMPTVCPACHQVGTLSDRGFGTEMIEEEVKQYLPEALPARMDLDTTRNKQSHQRLIDQFAQHKVNVLIGTQMVTKGLHFDDVSLVAVLRADAMLNQPDFRATERAFQMLEQVAGRAGRTGDTGQVFVQTSDPSHPVFGWLQSHDYEAFYQAQIKERELFHYPPFKRLIVLTLRHRDMGRLLAASETLHERLVAVFGTRISQVIIPSVQRIQNQYARQMVLKVEASAPFEKAKQMLLAEMHYVQSLPNCKGTVIQPDVDPM